MVLKLIRWLRGYVVFSISGAFPERFLNLINRRGIRHWDFLPDNNGYVCKMFLSDYLKIRPTARSASVRLKSSRGVGLPFFMKKYKRRRGLLYGAVAAVLILAVMSRFVWDIKLVGAEGLSETELYSAFESCGFKVGMLKSQLNTEDVERQVALKIPEVRWIAVNALNNVATVEIKQQSKRPEMNDDKSPCNIKASADGVITDIIVSSGVCEVKRGSAVAKNQLLVNSVVPIGEDSQKYVHSEATVMADVISDYSIRIPIKKNSIVLNKNYTEKSNADFLFLSFPLDCSPSLRGIEVYNTFNEALIINDRTLPLGKTARRSYYFDNIRETLDKKRAEKILRTRLALYECFSEGESTVKKRSVKLSRTSDSYVLRADYVFNKNIAQKQKLRIG